MVEFSIKITGTYRVYNDYIKELDDYSCECYGIDIVNNEDFGELEDIECSFRCRDDDEIIMDIEGYFKKHINSLDSFEETKQHFLNLLFNAEFGPLDDIDYNEEDVKSFLPCR